MKKLFVFMLVSLVALLFSFPVFAQVWYPANQKTVAWDAATTDDAGTPLPAGSTVGYKVYYKTTLATTPVFLIEVAVTQVTITFPLEGSYFVGISAIRKEGSILVGETAISWSDVAANCQGGATFGIRFYKMPSNPKNMRPL